MGTFWAFANARLQKIIRFPINHRWKSRKPSPRRVTGSKMVGQKWSVEGRSVAPSSLSSSKQRRRSPQTDARKPQISNATRIRLRLRGAQAGALPGAIQLKTVRVRKTVTHPRDAPANTPIFIADFATDTGHIALFSVFLIVLTISRAPSSRSAGKRTCSTARATSALQPAQPAG